MLCLCPQIEDYVWWIHLMGFPVGISERYVNIPGCVWKNKQAMDVMQMLIIENMPTPGIDAARICYHTVQLCQQKCSKE